MVPVIDVILLIGLMYVSEFTYISFFTFYASVKLISVVICLFCRKIWMFILATWTTVSVALLLTGE